MKYICIKRLIGREVRAIRNFRRRMMAGGPGGHMKGTVQYQV
jgi:hypothetical protein